MDREKTTAPDPQVDQPIPTPDTDGGPLQDPQPDDDK